MSGFNIDSDLHYGGVLQRLYGVQLPVHCVFLCYTLCSVEENKICWLFSLSERMRVIFRNVSHDSNLKRDIIQP